MLANNHARKAQVPVSAIDRMLRKWEPPTLLECHTLRRVDQTNEVVSVRGIEAEAAAGNAALRR
jgi:hypothetical protein